MPDNPNEFIEILKKRRKELNMTQRDLAQKCHLPQSTIGRIESYKRIPKLDTIFTILDKLNIRIEFKPIV